MNSHHARMAALAASISLYCCKPEESPPLALFTATVTSITTTTAKSGGFISAGKATSFGVCWNTQPNPTVADNKTDDGVGAGAFTSDLTDLTPHTLYYVRAYATDTEATTYGNELSFTTLGQAPTVVATSIIDVAHTSSIVAGTVNANYLTTQVTFEYGLDTNYGAAAPALQNPVNGSDDTQVIAGLEPLTEFSVYHFRIRAENAVGVTYGQDATFTMSGTKGTVTDIDGNSYETVVIGTQIWMAEDMRAVHFNDGTEISYVGNGLDWAALTTPAYTWLSYNAANKDTYGVYYNWYTVATGKLCPVGWHVPGRNEWMQLSAVSFMGVQAGGKMKTIGLDHWDSPNAGADNISGFSGRGGGLMLAGGGGASSVREQGIWWTSTLLSGALVHAGYSVLSKDNDRLSHASNFREAGAHVRCMKD